ADKTPIANNESAKMTAHRPLLEQKTANTAVPSNFNFMARAPAAPGVATAKILSQNFWGAN
ncbi:MAG: hypothetical protein WB005_21620, partial [Pseudolabrys sp.]